MAVGIYALTTKDNVLAYRLVDGNEAKATPELQTFTETLIDAYTSTFESHCDRKFKSREYTEYLDAKGHDELYPKHYPVTVVSGIWNDSAWEWADATLIDSSTYRVKNDNTLVKYGGTFGTGDQNIKIIYTGGFETIPDDLEHACITEINKYIDRIHDAGMTYKLAGETAYSLIPEALLSSTMLVLNKYKRKAIL